MVIPAGNLYVKDSDADGPHQLDSSPTSIDLGKHPAPDGRPRTSTSATWPRSEDDTDVNYGYALVDGKKSVYLPIIKKDTGVDPDGGGRHPQVDGAVPRRRAQGRDRQTSSSTSPPRSWRRSESVATEGVIGATLTGPDDPAVPPRPPERGRGRGQHPAGPPGVDVRALAHRQHDQHHVAGGPGPGHRHPGGRGDGGPSRTSTPRCAGPRQRGHWRSSGGTTSRPSRGCWPCSASSRCSSRRSS